MSKILDEKTGTINMAELSKLNGKTEFENAKLILGILAIKAEVTGITQRVKMACKEANK